MVESRHRGIVVGLRPDGTSEFEIGPANEAIYPRSCAKPLQLAAMLDAGLADLGLEEEQLAVAAASHSGQRAHVEQVRRILSAAGIEESALANTPGMPLEDAARIDLIRSGGGPDRIHQNCSGKHAAMLATCVAAGWPTASYLDPDHAVQRAIRRRIEELAGEPTSDVTVDGCGAPLFALTALGLARAFLRLVSAPDGSAEQRVAVAMCRHPELVGGNGRDVTQLMTAVPGLVAKDGAEGVYAAAAPELGAVALKIEDGSGRARPVVMVAGLRRLGVSSGEGVDHRAIAGLGVGPVLGHGALVGEIRPTI